MYRYVDMFIGAKNELSDLMISKHNEQDVRHVRAASKKTDTDLLYPQST